MKNRITLFIDILNNKGVTLAVAESVTCGMAADKLATAKGTANVFMGGVVCYHEDVKTGLMNIDSDLLRKHTCESPEVTEALVQSLSKLIKADIHAALTGLASDGGSESLEKPVGTVFFCIKYKNEIYHYRKLFKGSPMQIREKACFSLYDLILSIL